MFITSGPVHRSDDFFQTQLTWAQVISVVCLFVLLLYVPSQQLWSLQDGQFT